MKKMTLLAAVTGVLFAGYGCGKKTPCPSGKTCFDQPDAYVVFLSEDFNKAIDYLNAFSDHAYDRALDSAQMNIDSLVGITARGMKKTAQLAPFKSDSLLRDRYKEAFTYLNQEINTHFGTILEVYAKDSNATFPEQDSTQAIMKRFDEKLDQLVANILKAQNSFAEKNKLNIVEE